MSEWEWVSTVVFGLLIWFFMWQAGRPGKIDRAVERELEELDRTGRPGERKNPVREDDE